jgi:hypothetical protein
VLGLGFQMGAPKFIWTVAKGGTIITLDVSKSVVDVYRKEWAPRCLGLWYGLSDAAVNAVWQQEEQESHGIVYRLEDRWLWPRSRTAHHPLLRPQAGHSRDALVDDGEA